MIKPISGRESSVLALLAQTIDLSESDKERILSSLDGQALKIAKVIVGGKCSNKQVRLAAKGFQDWAKNLKSKTV
jgi:hypothetical protein